MTGILDQQDMVYLIGLTVITIVIYLLIRYLITTYEQQRTEWVEDLKRFQAVPLEAPIKNPVKRARKKAVNSIGGRFTIIRRLSYIILFFVWLVAFTIPFLGKAPAAVISLFVTVAAVVVGIAAKPFVENVISGIVISFSKQLRLGDTVMIDNLYGTVEDITITHTIIKIWDWKRYIVPNSTMLQKDFINYTINDSYQWTSVTFWVSYDADLELVKNRSMEIAAESEYVLENFETDFWVMDLAKDGVQCWVAGWVNSPGNAWLFRSQMRMDLAIELKKLGVKTHMLHLDEGSAAARPSPGKKATRKKK